MFFVLKSTLLLGVLLVLTARNRGSASVRHLLLALAMLSVPGIFILEGFSPTWFTLAVPEFLQAWIAEADASVLAQISAAQLADWLVISRALVANFLPLYVFVCALLLVYWLLQIACTTKWIWNTHLLEGKRTLVQQGLWRQVSLRQSCMVESPATWGVFRPIVVVPRDWLLWSKEKRNAVMTHEFAHISRYDALTSLLSGLICCLFWFNPLVWLVHKRLLISAEQACDDSVINQNTSPLVYAGHLMEIARSRRMLLAPAMSNKSTLSARIHVLLDHDTCRKKLATVQILGIGVLTAALVLLLGFTDMVASPNVASPTYPLLSMHSSQEPQSEVEGILPAPLDFTYLENEQPPVSLEIQKLSDASHTSLLTMRLPPALEAPFIWPVQYSK